MAIHLWLVEGRPMSEQPGQTGEERAAAGSGRGSRQRWRTIVAVLLIVVGCVQAALAGAAVWARNQVTNTDRSVRTVVPLAADPAIQAAGAEQAGLQIGPVGTWVYANKQLLRIDAVTLVLIEFLAQPPRATVAPAART
jgi:hypothetical protein